MMLTACTFQVKHRGYVFPPDLDAVVADIKTTAQLTREIGSPQVKTIKFGFTMARMKTIAGRCH